MRIVRRAIFLFIVVLGFSAFGYVSSLSKRAAFIKTMDARFADKNLPVKDRPQVRWWLDLGYHTDESLRRSVKNLYDLGYGGMEILCLSNNTINKAIYGWGTEEWQHDLQVLVKAAGELGMSVNFAAGPDWQPTFLYYGTNADVAKNRSWKDYYENYSALRKYGRNILKTVYGNANYNVYKTDDGVLTIDPNVDVFNQGLGLGYTIPDTSKDAKAGDTITKTVKYVKAGQTVEIDLTNYTYVPRSSGFGPGMGGPPGGPPQGGRQQGGPPQGGTSQGGRQQGAPPQAGMQQDGSQGGRQGEGPPGGPEGISKQSHWQKRPMLLKSTTSRKTRERRSL